MLQVINQDNAWDHPSPQDSSRANDSVWRSSLNTTGTEIWENTVRHKNNSHKQQGTTSAAAAAAATESMAGASAAGASAGVASHSSSWNHTPTTHIGGVWGEEDQSPNSMWNGIPTQTNGSSNNSHSSTSNASNGSWPGPQVHRPPPDAIPDPPVPLSSGWKPDHHRTRVDAHVERPDLSTRPNHLHHHLNHSQSQPPAPVLHPSSSWNGNATNWDELQPPTERLGTSGWSAEPPPAPKAPVLLRSESHPVQNMGWKREERISNSSSGSGWDDTRGLQMVNGMERRAVMDQGLDDKNVDDGTSAWGNPTSQPAKIHRWKEEDESGDGQQGVGHSNAKMPVAANSANGMNAPISPNGGMPVLSGPGMIRLPPTMGQKDMSWPKGPGTWSEGRESWNEEKSGGRSGWGDASPATSLWNRERKGNWSDGQVDTSSWNGPKHKPLTKEMICASKQFRVLNEMGFRKEDVESCLRATNMNENEALVELRAWAADERRKTSPANTPTTSLLTSAVGPNPSLSSGNSRPLPQAFPSVSPCPFPVISLTPSVPFQVNEVTSALRGGQSGTRVGMSGQANLPSEKQLLHLVQQIQLAVHMGHLNAQVRLTMSSGVY